MAIKVGGTTVIDDSRNLSNIGIITASQTTIGTAVTISSSGINISSGIITCKTLSNATLSNYTETFVNVGNTGSATTIGLSTSGYFRCTLDQNTSLTFDYNNSEVQFFGFAVEIKNGTGGPFSITWPVNVYWPDGGSTPSRNTSDGRTDIWSFSTTDSGTTWLGNLAITNYNV
jgi:hypothetical protein